MSRKITQPEPITAALRTIANELRHMVEKTDKDGSTISVNQMGFAQKRVLNGICYSLELTLQSTRENIDKACVDLRQLVRSNRGDEISMRNIQSKQAWIERLETQEWTLMDLFAKAQDVYAEATDEAYVPAKVQRALREQPKAANPVVSDAAKLLARRGFAEPVKAQPQGGDLGTESADPGQAKAA